MAGAKEALEEKLRAKELYVCAEHVISTSRSRRQTETAPFTAEDFHAPRDDPIFMTQLDPPRPLIRENHTAFLRFLNKGTESSQFTDVKELGVAPEHISARRALKASERKELQQAEEEARRLEMERKRVLEIERLTLQEKRRLEVEAEAKVARAQEEAAKAQELAEFLSHPVVQAHLEKVQIEHEQKVKEIKEQHAHNIKEIEEQHERDINEIEEQREQDIQAIKKRFEAELSEAKSNLVQAEARAGFASRRAKNLASQVTMLEQRRQDLQTMLEGHAAHPGSDGKKWALDYDYFKQ